MVPVVVLFYLVLDEAIWPVFQSLGGVYAFLYMTLIGFVEMASVAQMVRMVSET